MPANICTASMRSHFNASVLVALFCVICVLELDKRVVYIFQHIPHFYVQILDVVTMAGVSTVYILGSAALFLLFQWVPGKRDLANRALLVFLSVSAAGVVNAALKFVFGRYRPKALLEAGTYGFDFLRTDYIATSFPSGHANTIAAVMVCMCLVYPRYRHLFIPFAVLVVMSRVMLCVHFISDVVWGAYLGGLTAIWVSSQMDRRGLNHKPSPGGKDASPPVVGQAVTVRGNVSPM